MLKKFDFYPKMNIDILFDESSKIIDLKKDIDIVLSASFRNEFAFRVSFPLIELLFRLLLNNVIDSNIEVFNQGTYRTMASLIDNNRSVAINELSQNTVDLLAKYFIGDNCLRNLVCHTSGLKEVSSLDMSSIRGLLIRLLRYNLKFQSNNEELSSIPLIS